MYSKRGIATAYESFHIDFYRDIPFYIAGRRITYCSIIPLQDFLSGFYKCRLKKKMRDIFLHEDFE